MTTTQGRKAKGEERYGRECLNEASRMAKEEHDEGKKARRQEGKKVAEVGAFSTRSYTRPSGHRPPAGAVLVVFLFRARGIRRYQLG
jgi:hypothetical protein